jgi:CheY-like chemotaxis protein
VQILEASPTPVILLADDDPDDREMTMKAAKKCQLSAEFHCVSDGEELLEFLRLTGRYLPPALAPAPALILLDLNMPKMDGREVLAEIKRDPALRHIPVVVLTTSNAERDVSRTYDLGGSSFISKPATMAAFVQVMTVLGQYWFEIVKLPAASDGH